jgi:hypothetical protein
MRTTQKLRTVHSGGALAGKNTDKNGDYRTGNQLHPKFSNKQKTLQL